MHRDHTSLKSKQTYLFLLLLPITILAMEESTKKVKPKCCSLLATPNDNIIRSIAKDINSMGNEGYVKIESPFLSNSTIKDELLQAAQRGVHVRVFTDLDSANKLKIEFAKTKIENEIYLIQNSHVKCIIIDGAEKIVWLGSMNMSEHSPQNYEIMVRCTDPDFFKELWQRQPQAIDFNSRQIIYSSSDKAQAAKKRVIEEFVDCDHPHDYLYFVAYTLDDPEIERALLTTKKRTDKPITVILDVQSWKNHRLRFNFLKPLVLAGANVYIFNKDETQKTTFGYNKLMHIKAILRQCNQKCLSLISTGNFTPKGKQEINYDLWQPCSFAFCQQFKKILDAIIKESTKLNADDFPPDQVIRDNTQLLLQLMKYSNKIYANKNEIVRLIKDGANLDITDEYGTTPLMKAAEIDQLEIVKALIEAGADVNFATKDHGTALLYAAQSGHYQVVQMLIEAGAELDHTDQWGNTPLFRAIQASKNKTATLLITAGADINKGGDYRVMGFRMEFKGVTPPIIEAVKRRNPELVEALLNAGAQVNKKDREGLTALLRAYTQNDIDLIKILAQYKANLNILHPKTGKTVLIEAVLKNNLKLVQTLLEAGADIDAKDDQGKTAIYYAEKAMQSNRDSKKLEQLNTILELLKETKFIKDNPEAMEF